jgi:(E)-4-hydroxy-3-methylbut-2-enyl-diphosphate synthase
MANTDTNDIEASVNQAKIIAAAGSTLLRYATQGKKEVANLAVIQQQLRNQGIALPLVADVHFNSDVANAAAQVVEKVRINPGNFVKSKTDSIYTEKEFLQEKELIYNKLKPLIEICKQNHTAIRIGVNHGSLSPRIVGKYGDTPEGLVQSCIEFLEMFEKENFRNLVLSIKSSNPIVMIYSVRLLVSEMKAKNMHYPLHLGVTEAGDGEDGRIKSAVGIGSLLADGIGDTIRVSLSEPPENEIPVAKALTNYISERTSGKHIDAEVFSGFNPFEYSRRKTNAVGKIGGENVPVVVAPKAGNYSLKPDFTLDRDALNLQPISLNSLTEHRIAKIKEQPEKILLLYAENHNITGEMNAVFHKLLTENIKNPVIISAEYNEQSIENFQIKAATDIGSVLINGFGDGILLINNNPAITDEQVNSTAFGILQATRVRMTRNDYIACPSCGRTLFDLQTTLQKVKEATAHLKNLKIAVMGCIVNGIGEMADADYGYVGAGKGKVSLYKGKICIEKNIPENEAIEKLLQIIENQT